MYYLLAKDQVGRLSFYLLIVTVIVSSWYAPLAHLPFMAMVFLVFALAIHFFSSYHIDVRWDVAFLGMLLLLNSLSGLVEEGLSGILSGNNAKYILIFTVYSSIVAFFDRDTYWTLAKLALKLLLPHTILCIIEYFIVPSVDYVGGIFGIVFGISNTCNSVFLTLCTIILVALWKQNEIGVVKLISGLIMCMISAGFAEIKLYVFEIIILGIIYVIFSNNIKRALIVLVSVLVFVFASVWIILAVSPEFSGLLTIEGLSDYLMNGYGNRELVVNRTNGFEFVYDLFFNDNIKALFCGIGNGSESSVLANDLHIVMFSYAYIFYSSGVLGISLFVAFFVNVFAKALKNKDSVEGKITLLTVIISIVLFFYDSQLISIYTSPLIYFLLSASSISTKDEL